MTHKQIVRPICFTLLFAVIHNVTSDCRFHLKNIGNRPLIVHKYKPDGTPVFHYPHEETDCIVKSKDQRIHFACPGPNSKYELRSVDILNEDGSYVFAHSVKGSQRSMYLLNDSDENLIRLQSIIIKFDSQFSTIQCLSNLVPKMRKTGELKYVGSERSRYNYTISFKLNEIDILNVFEILHFFEVQRIMAHVRIVPIIERQRYIKLAQQYDIDKEYRSGLIYQTKQLNFTELYSPEYQKASFQKHYQNAELTKQYFSGNNSLVIGQLIFAEDMIYAAEKMSTYFYENTVPIWKSVYEGNWQSVGKVIRTIVDESVKEMEVYAWNFENFSLSTSWNFGNFSPPSSERPWVLGDSTSSQDSLAIPRLLVKAAVDVNNGTRGMVFHTHNDPYLDLKVQPSDVCSQIADCEELNPQFKNLTKGYTFCCYPKDSYLLKKMFP